MNHAICSNAGYHEYLGVEFWLNIDSRKRSLIIVYVYTYPLSVRCGSLLVMHYT